MTISKMGVCWRPGPINIIELMTSINQYYLKYKEYSSKKKLHYTYIFWSLPIQFSIMYFNSEHSSFGQLLDLWVCTKIMYWCKRDDILDEGKYLGEIKYGTCTNFHQNKFDDLTSGKIFCLLACLNLVLFLLASVKFVSEKEKEKKCCQILSWYSSLKIQNFFSIGILKYNDGPN